MLGKKIKELRTDLGITQTQLAKAIGVSQSTIFFWESGTNEPTASCIAALAKFFNVSADALLDIEDNIKDNTPDFMKLYYKMTARQKRLTVRIMRDILDNE